MRQADSTGQRKGNSTTLRLGTTIAQNEVSCTNELQYYVVRCTLPLVLYIPEYLYH